jgi:hypothetical protein
MADSTSLSDITRCRTIFLASFPGEVETFEAVEAAVLAGKAHIRFSDDGQSFVILQPVHDLHVWTVGGTMEGVMELEATVSAAAAERGFDRMTALPSRAGWDRALLARGWKLEPTTPLVKELAK